jgi:hypothetical protein
VILGKETVYMCFQQVQGYEILQDMHISCSETHICAHMHHPRSLQL